MALKDEVKSRFGAKYLVAISNPYDSPATTIDDGRMDLAVTDTIADFEIYAGLVYDNANAKHVTVAVEGVVSKLMLRNVVPGGEERHKDYVAKLESLALVTSRDRVLPSTNSTLQPTKEQSGSRPELDPSRLRGYQPGQRGTGSVFRDDGLQ